MQCVTHYHKINNVRVEIFEVYKFRGMFLTPEN